MKLCILCDSSAARDKQTERSEASDHGAVYLVPAGLLNRFQTRVHFLQLFLLLSSLFIRSIPGGQFKCHGQDCEMRSVLGSLSPPEDSAGVTLAREMRVDS